MTEYKRFSDEAWNNFGKNLLAEKGSSGQKTFLKICRSGKADFLEFEPIKNLLSEEGPANEGAVDFTCRFTEAEFCNPPHDTQKIIWETFESIPKEVKTYCSFWGYIIVNMIKNDCIKPEYLAADLNGITQTGIYMIDKALSSNDEKEIDDRVRRILRSMCNPVPRGKRIVFNDFHLGKSYWRWQWSKEMSGIGGMGFEEVIEILNKDYYQIFSEKMHTGKSYISFKNVFGGLLLYLKQAEGEKITSGILGKIIDRISFLNAWKALEIQDADLNREEILKLAFTVINASKKL